jgi:Zn-dependent protease
MKPSFTLGRPFGINVGAHWSLLAFGLLAMWTLAGSFSTALPGYGDSTYWVTAGLVVVLFIGGLVVHELAHALVARRHGIEVEGITLWILGGLAKLSREPTTPRSELLISAAGPLASFGVGLALYGAAMVAEALTDARVLISGLLWLAVANVVLAVFNLLPARPMDGGRILTGILWARMKDHSRAMLTAAKVSGVVGWGLVGFGGYLLLAGGAFSGIWLAVIGWMVLQSSTAERRLLEWRANLRGITFRQVMSAPPPTIAIWAPVRDVVEAGRRSATPFHVVADGAGVARGVVTLIDATRVAMTRPDLAVGELVRPLADGAVAGPDEQVSAVLGVRIVQLPVLVRDGEGRIIGQVRPEDLSRSGAGVRPHDARHPHPTPAGDTAWPPPRAEEQVRA